MRLETGACVACHTGAYWCHEQPHRSPFRPYARDRVDHFQRAVPHLVRAPHPRTVGGGRCSGADRGCGLLWRDAHHGGRYRDCRAPDRRKRPYGTPADRKELRAILEDIVEADRRAGEVIGRMRAMLKKGQGKMQSLDLNMLALQRCAMRLLEVALASQTIELSPASSTGMAVGTKITEADPAVIRTMRLRAKMP